MFKRVMVLAALALLAAVVVAASGAAQADKQQAKDAKAFRHFEYARYDAAGKKVWDGSSDILDGWLTVKRTSKADPRGDLIYIQGTDNPFYISPEKMEGARFRYASVPRFYYASFPGVGQIFAREHEPGETWVFTAGGLTKVDTIGHCPKRSYHYDWTSHVGDKKVAEGMVEFPSGWVACGIEKKGEPRKVIIVKTPEAALSDCKPTDLIPEGRTWAHVVIPGAGDVYATVDEPGQTWTVTCFGVATTAGAGTDRP